MHERIRKKAKRVRERIFWQELAYSKIPRNVLDKAHEETAKDLLREALDSRDYLIKRLGWRGIEIILDDFSKKMAEYSRLSAFSPELKRIYDLAYEYAQNELCFVNLK